MEWIHKKLYAAKKKTESIIKESESTFLIIYLQQIMDMSLVGMINLAVDEK